MKDLIIGCASGYDWDKVRLWVNSIKKTNFEGDVVITGTNFTKEFIDKATENGVLIHAFGEPDAEGNVNGPTNGAPHVERFFFIWHYLNENGALYRRVVTTDVRDVVFQKNPVEFLLKNTSFGNYHGLATSEGLVYEDEPWGARNLLETFGPFFYERLKSNLILNVGVIAGVPSYVESLALLIFQLSINRPIAIVDQAVYNMLLDTPTIRDLAWSTENSDSWAVNLGTTIQAVESGAGDLGQICKNTDAMKQYKMNFRDIQPTIEATGIVKNDIGQEYCIVHQYDRIPGLQEKIEALYGEV